MKKVLLLLAVSIFVSVSALFAQCNPDLSLTHPGTSPDSVTGLPHAKVGTAYSTVIQIKVLTDTNVLISGTTYHATVDSIVLNSVSGLPTGFSFQTNPVSKTFLGGSNACVLLTGLAPTSGMEGAHPLTIN